MHIQIIVPQLILKSDSLIYNDSLLMIEEITENTKCSYTFYRKSELRKTGGGPSPQGLKCWEEKVIDYSIIVFRKIE